MWKPFGFHIVIGNDFFRSIHMKKEQKKSVTNKELLIALGLLAVLLAAVLGIILLSVGKNKPATEPTGATQASQMPYNVPGFTVLEGISGTSFDNGLSVLCTGSYSGAYLEDGTDEQVQDVLCIVVKNNGQQMIEYGRITLSSEGQTAEFVFSGLPVGAAVLVQEKNRLTAFEQTDAFAFSLAECALPGSIVLAFGDDFELYPDDGVLNVKNISGRDFSGDVSVFYKNFAYGLFLGGITYRARISGGIPNGAIAQSMQKHYQLDTSAIVYMAYGS